MEKILIHADVHRATQFENSVTDIAAQCNELISQFQIFQPWQKITTLEAWHELVSDPVQLFDNVLIAQINLTSSGGRKPNPEILAPMFDIDRQSFLNVVAGKMISDPSCVPCKSVRIRPGKLAVSLSEYNRYSQYLIFRDGGFDLNLEAIERQKEKFNFFADADDKTLKHFQQLVKMLNSHDAKYHIAVTDKQVIAKACRLQLSRGTEGQFMYSNEYIKNEILKAQYEHTR